VPPQALDAGGVADVVVANILAGALIELAPTLTAATRSGGHLALSGILSAQAPEVSACYAAAFALGACERDGWVRLAGPRHRAGGTARAR
jgi:ribosomal protein L11 methyltransferase